MKFRDTNTQIYVLMLDFPKAFHTVPHNRLLHKLSRYGVRGQLLQWISAFLKGRSQRVVVDGAHSPWTHVDSGVPQGTVLGPLLFLTHINDITRVIKSQCRLFADDCLLYRPIRTEEDQHLLQQDLLGLEEWSVKWGMRFNASKCEVIRIHRSKRPLDHFYTIGGQVLQEVDSCKYLGVNINNKLDWSTHIHAITSRANRTLGFLRRNLSECPQELKALSYVTLVRSVLEYACQAWDPYTKKDTDCLEKVQRSAARFVTRDYSSYSSVTDMLSALKWRSLASRRQDLRLILMFQITHDMVAIPTESLLTSSDSRTRSSHGLTYKHLPSKTDSYKNSFFPRTIREWNALEPSLVACDNTDTFRERVKASHRCH